MGSRLIFVAGLAASIGISDCERILAPEPAQVGTIEVLSDFDFGGGRGGSIGGYAVFGTLVAEDGTDTGFEVGRGWGSDVAAGSYELNLWTVAQSDSIGLEQVPGGTPRIHRAFGSPTARCSIGIDVPAGLVLRYIYRTNTSTCEIVLAQPEIE